jgi:hypothetical protein
VLQMLPALAGATAAKVLECFFVLCYLLNSPLGEREKITTHENQRIIIKKTRISAGSRFKDPECHGRAVNARGIERKWVMPTLKKVQ